MRETAENRVAADTLRGVEPKMRAALERALGGDPILDDQARRLISLPAEELAPLLTVAAHVRDGRKGRTVTYSPKVFLPVTNLCRDYCSYCTFRRDPDSPGAWTMLPDEVRACSREGSALGCIEALMCLGDRPERVFASYRELLASLGCATTIDYVETCCLIAREEGLLPHTNAGILTRDEMRRLKPLNASLGLMLENVSPRLREAGGPHRHSPDKDPELRLRMIREAGELRIPFTTGILIGIGETLAERVDSLRAIADLHAEHGHVQEVIVQNFRAKPATRMAASPEPESYDLARTLAVARLMMPGMNLQAPPNLSPHDHRLLLSAGINDWGGVSPLTKDFVNPEAPWPHIAALARTCAAEGFTLRPRLPVYDEYADQTGFVDEGMREAVLMARTKQTASPAGDACEGGVHVR